MDHEPALENAPPGIPGGNNCHALEVVRQAERELRRLTEERAKITKRICRLKQTIIGLADIFGDGILDTGLVDLIDREGSARRPGITPICRTLLLKAGRPISARAVCDGIQRTAPALLAHYKDPMATIHTILGRLVYYGEATCLSGDRGERSWLWAAERKNGLTAPHHGDSRPTAVVGCVALSGDARS